MNKEKPSGNIIIPEEVSPDAIDLVAESIIRESDPLIQLDNIHDLSEFLKTTHLTKEEATELSSMLGTASLKDSNTPLISLSLTYFRDCVAADYLDDSEARARIKTSEYFVDDLQNQEQLHEEYPALPKDPGHFVVKFAPGIASSINAHYFNTEELALEGAANPLSEDVPTSENPFMDLLYNRNDGSTVPLWALEFAHDVRFRGVLEDKLGLNLADIPLESQMQLLEFMTRADNGRFDSLCSTLNSLEPSLRLSLAESFVAADFGEDFGDALLSIANSPRISDEQLSETLDTVKSCRESIRGITEFYQGFDGGKFAREYARAANERLTDAVMVFGMIAAHGETEVDLGWPGKVKFNYDTAMEALNYEAKSLEIINGTLGAVSRGSEGAYAEQLIHPDMLHDYSMYSFYSPDYGYVLLYTRPEGSGGFNSAIEYGKNRSRYNTKDENVGVEASISLTVNPEDPFSLPNPFRVDPKAARNPNFYDPDTMNKVSALRLDREGRSPGMAANNPNRDPINPDGMVSVDLAAIGDRSDTPSGKIARLFSAGGKMRARGSDSSLNHNTRWFDQEKYGIDTGFRKIVEYVNTMATSWCDAYPPGEDEGFKGAARKMIKNRGKKAVGYW